MNELNSLHRGYNFDLDRYGWHSTDYQGVLLTVARVRSATPRYSINQLGCRCQQRCMNSSHVIRQQRSWTANVELPLFSNIYSLLVKIDGRVFTMRWSRQTDINQAKLTRDLFFFFFFYLHSHSFSFCCFFCRLMLAQFFFSRTWPHNETLTLCENNYTFRTYTRGQRRLLFTWRSFFFSFFF